MKIDKMTKAQLQTMLTDANIPFTTKMSKGQLIALAQDAQRPRAKPSPTKIKRVGVKQALFNLFRENPTTEISVEDFIKAFDGNPTVSTVKTMVSDLRNPKYAVKVDGEPCPMKLVITDGVMKLEDPRASRQAA